LAVIRPVAPALALIVALAAGSVSAAASPPAAAAPASDPATRAAPACAKVDFTQFLDRFSAEIALQERATADPLTMTHLDADAAPEPAPVSRTLALADVEWPVIPDLRIARRGGREVQVSGSGAEREVRVRTPDTGDQQVYRFARRPCWTLIEVDDQAL
jgi:hypothetical protein